jgi:enhancer of polycomb-like protein
MKKDDLQLSIDIYEKRYQAKDFTGQLLQEYTAATTKSRYLIKFSDMKLSILTYSIIFRPAFAPLYSNQYYHNTSSNLVSHSTQWNSSQNYPSIHLNHHHLQNKRDFDGMSTSSSRKEKRQYKKRKHKTQREQVIKQGKNFKIYHFAKEASIKYR